ncbi:MAG: hypothetical protein V3U03_02325 [Myxococcota bacterium]
MGARSWAVELPGFAFRSGEEDTDSMDVKIKVSVDFTVSSTALEDALAEYDELTVAGLIREIIDKAVACDEIRARVEEGPNTLEEYDQLVS